MTKQEFFEKLKNKGYDLTKFDFSMLPDKFLTKDKIEIVCKKCNTLFRVRCDMFIFQYRCTICTPRIDKNKAKSTRDEFIEKCNKMHSEKRKKYNLPNYDYSKTIFKTTKDKITIYCSLHGNFEQRLDMHLRGQGCPECGKILTGINQQIPVKEFIEKCNKIHNGKYDYSMIDYHGYNYLINVICPEHGIFTLGACNHYQGVGCPKCSNNGKSELERELQEFIRKLLPNEKILENKRNILKNSQFEADIYIPSKQIAFEFNGLYWHCEDRTPDNYYHQNKYKKFLENNIHLIQIWEDDWSEKRLIIESRIKNILDLTDKKIYARKCVIKQVEPNEERLFLIANHLQEYIASQICYGLYYNDELVSLMSFGKNRLALGNKFNNDWEMYRFCNLKNTNVIGAASKLFKYFINKFKPSKIISFANCNWSIDNEYNLYRQLGFELQEITKPNYSYLTGKLRVNRFSLRKDILISKYNCPPEMSEHEFCLSKGWYRIYDAGNLKYIWKKNPEQI